MNTRPAIDDHNMHAGLKSMGDASNPNPRTRTQRGESRGIYLNPGGASDSSSDPKPEILTLLLDQIPGFTYRCRLDQERTMEYISEGSFQLLGYFPSDLLHNRTVAFGQLIHPDDVGKMWRQLGDAIRAGRTYDLIYRIRTATKVEKWIRDIGRGVISKGSRQPVLEGLLLDISELKASERYKQRQIARFDALRKIDLAITGSFDLRVILDILLDQVISHLNVDAGDVLVFDPATQVLEFAAGKGFRTSSLQYTRLRLGEGYAGLAAIEHRLIHIKNLVDSMGELKRAPQIANEGFRSYFAVPLIAKGQIKGVLEVFHRSAFDPDPDWIEFLETLAGQAAIAIENATLFKELQRTNIELTMAYDATLEGWSKALEMRDQGISGHTQQAYEMTLVLAQKLGMNSAELVHLRRGSLLHDIGELGIPEYILLKPGKLTEEERGIVQQHPIYAYKLLSTIPSLGPAIDIPYCHHEKWDGSGYPRGIMGEEIPLTARIFTLADVWFALLADRPYRPAWTREMAIKYVREQRGKHFDPRIVDLFFSISI